MIPITEREAVDWILKQAEENMTDYRYDMLRFRLLLSLKAPHVWRVHADRYPDVSVTMFSRKAKAPDDFVLSYYDVIKRRGDLARVAGEMAVRLREMEGEVTELSDVPSDDLPAVQGVVNELFQTTRPARHPFATFVLNHSHIESSPTPDGYLLKSLDHTAAYIDQFNSHQGFMPGKDIKHLFQDCIEHLPSAGVFTQNDELVGYILTNHFGSIGKLYVDPDHRRSGIASALITYLSNRVVDDGYFTKCLINAYVWNEKSYACFKKLGYQYIPNSERNWLMIGDRVR